MKGKLPSIVMALMALVLVLSLAVVAAPAKPAEAGDLSWATVITPQPLGRGIYIMGDVDDLALSPNFDTDKVIYTTGTNAAVAPFIEVMRSTNGGRNWTTLSNPGLAAAGMIAVAPDDANYIVVTDGITIWASNDAGGTWSALGTATTIAGAATDVITSIDVGPVLSGTHPIVIGVADGTGLFAETNGVYIWGWGAPPNLSWSGQNFGGVANEDVYAVAFSSNYSTDFTIVAAGSVAAATQVHLGDGRVAVAAPGNWDAAGGFGAAWPIVLFAQPVTSATIALPEDFNGLLGGSQVAFVGTAGAALAANNDAWRVRNVGATALVSGVTGVNSLDFVGTIGGSAALIVGDTAASATAPYANVVYTTQPWGSPPWWSGPNKLPTGASGLALVALSPDFLTTGLAYCGTGGGVSDESALSWTQDSCVSWNQVSLIDTLINTGIMDVWPSPDYANDNMLFIATCQTFGAGFDSLWRSDYIMHVYWERIDVMVTNNNNALVRVSPEYATDSTIYWGEPGGAGNRIRVSNNGGDFFLQKTLLGALAGFSDMIVEDATTLYVSSGTSVGRSTDAGSTWPVIGNSGVGVMEMEQGPNGDIVCSGTGVLMKITDTSTMAISLFGSISGEGAGSVQWIAFDPDYATNATVYIGGGGAVGQVWRFVGTSKAHISAAPAPAIGIAMSGDGALYVADPAAWVVAPPAGGVLRSIEPGISPVILGTQPAFFRVTQGFAPIANAPTLALLRGVEGSSYTLFTVDTANVYVAGMIVDKVLEYTDTLTPGVVPAPDLIAPADGATGVGVITGVPIGIPAYDVTFEWESVPAALGYDLDWDTDPGMMNFTRTTVNAPATSWTLAATFLSDKTFYWRMRVNNTVLGTASAVGPWSEVQSFTTGPGVAPPMPDLTGPPGGATNQPLKPTFSWTPVEGMTGYDFQLATDAGFTDKVVDASLGNQQTYTPTDDLEEGTQYFWRVRAHDGSTTAWASAGFTTGLPPPPIPYWIWILIGLGAVLAVAVIVLIVRTRRAV